MEGRGYRAASGAVLLTCAVACAAPPSPGPGTAAPERAAPVTVWDGVYTAAQAERGAAAYAESCSSCHAADLRGSSNAPSLVGVSFLFLWEDRSLDELFTVIRTQMPTNAPNGLPEQTYLAILAHLLEANGFPAGDRELVADPALLRAIAVTGPGSTAG